MGLCNFVSLLKIYLRLFIPNCTRNHVITYTNFPISLDHRRNTTVSKKNPHSKTENHQFWHIEKWLSMLNFRNIRKMRQSILFCPLRFCLSYSPLTRLVELTTGCVLGTITMTVRIMFESLFSTSLLYLYVLVNSRNIIETLVEFSFSHEQQKSK